MKKFLLALFLTFGFAGGASAQHMDINELIAGIGGREFLEAASRVDTAASIRIVRLSSLAGAQNAGDRLSSATDIKARDIAYLQGRLVLNPLALTALRGAGVGPGQIVTITGHGDGAVVLYVDDL